MKRLRSHVAWLALIAPSAFLLHCSSASSPPGGDAVPDASVDASPDASHPVDPHHDGGADAADAAVDAPSTPEAGSTPEASTDHDTGPTCGAHGQACCATAAPCESGLTCISDHCSSVSYAWSSTPLPSGFVPVAIDGASSSSVWIVGNDASAFQGQAHAARAMRFDGSTWTAATFPDGMHDATAVWVDDVQNAWISTQGPGYVYVSDGAQTDLALSPSVTSTYAMWGTPEHVWLGSQWNYGAGPLYELEADNTWSIVALPSDTGTDGVGSIWAAGDDLWICIGPTLRHRSAGQWTTVDIGLGTNQYPGHLRGISNDDLWFFVTDYNTYATTVRHFDGASTKTIAAPNGASPSSLSFASASDGWVVGSSMIARWDGTALRDASTDPGAPTGAALVWTSGSDVFAVGGSTIYRGSRVIK